ncbi:MAG: PilW family protein [Gammaproteobacteria bacterium]|nr:PilW family protein [Gammaproteobacteria bacterium]
MRHMRHYQQSGLSLIELMIAMAVGLILLAGVLSIFISSRQGYSTNSAVATVQENGRFALDFIRDATRQAGYMGCGTSGQIVSYLNPVPGSLPYDFDIGVYGFEYTGTAPTKTFVIGSENPAAVVAGDWSPTLDASLPASGADYAIPGSDVLVVRYAVSDPAYITSIPSNNSASYKLNNNFSVSPSDIVLISNCLSGIVMQITNVSAGGGSGNVVANTGGAWSPGNGQKGIPASFVGAQLIKPVTDVFYIGQGTDKSPALFEAVTDPTAATGFDYNELVPGVENMQVLYGVDTTGTRVPSEYDTADVVNAANAWNRVVSVRVSLLVRSGTGAVPQSAAAPAYDLLDTNVIVPRDTRLRRIFTSDIYIRNTLL